MLTAEYLLRLMVLDSKPRTGSPGAFLCLRMNARLAKEVRGSKQQEQSDGRAPQNHSSARDQQREDRR
jgi:hypothetical protein